MRKALFTLMCLVAMMAAGTSLKAQEVTIVLAPGWTWISYPNAEPMAIATALGNFEPMEGDMVKYQYGASVYSRGRWTGSVTYFMPGWGYKYYSKRTEDVELVFAQPASSNVATATPTDITATSAVAGGMVILPEGSHVFLRGVCWGTAPSPDIDGSHTTDGTGIGSFTTTLEGLDPNTIYYVRAYAVSDRGLAYGNEVSFTTIPIWTIEATSNPMDGGTITGTGDYEQNAVCTLTAIANEGYIFANWTENGEVVSTDATYTFTVNGDRNLTANFGSLFVIEATTFSMGGEVSGGGLYQEGAECTLIATAYEGYTFIYWTENDEVVSTDANYTFIVDANRNLIASFGFVIDATANTAEGGVVSGGGLYQEGAECTLIAEASEGYTFVYWTENFEVISTEATYTFTVNMNRNLVAIFGIPCAGTYVDLGLPSGTLWATCNVGADIPEGYGDYFAWGETQPKDYYEWITYQYRMGSIPSENFMTKYCNNSNYGYNGFTDNLNTLLPEDDAATANWGSDWRMPTKEEWQELYNNTTCTWTTQNGVNGRLFTANNGNSLFLPAAGNRWLYDLNDVNSYGDYWSSSLDTDYPYFAWNFGFDSDDYYMGQNYRYIGRSVRAVRSSQNHAYVDLGLPSGLLWATCNVGADNPEDYGDYFAWGETQPKDTYNWSTYQYCNGSYNSLTKYCNNSSYGYNGFTDNLTTLLPEDDAATANWGSGWRMPTQAEFQELLDHTTMTWTTQNGVNGRLFTASNGNSLFLPAAGYRNFSNLNNAGSYGNYWSSSLDTGIPDYAWNFYFSSGGYGMNSGYLRNYGFTVRPVRSLRQN